MLLLRNEILPKLLLRRTKVQCADDLTLPPRSVVLRKDRFDALEADYYQVCASACVCCVFDVVCVSARVRVRAHH